MNKKIKSVLSFIMSMCVISSLSIFSVNADETEVAGMGADDINDIVSQIVEDTGSETSIVTTIANTSTTTIDSISIDTSSSEITDILSTDITTTTIDTTPISDLSTTTTIDESATTTTIDNSISVTISDTSDTTTLSSDSAITTSLDGTTVSTEFETTSQTDTTTEYVSKNIILDLDLSGSMSGDPMDAMKKAATDFCTKMLSSDPNAKIAIVVFGDDSEIAVDYTNDINLLTEYIQNAELQGVTNMVSSFEDVKLLLDTGNGQSKSVIIMADGMPNEVGDGTYDVDGDYGYSANASLNYDNQNLKPFATVYTIGFFHNMSDYSKETAVPFMKDLASNPTLYYDADVDNLDKVFNEIADEIIIKDETTNITENNSENINNNTQSTTITTTTDTKSNSDSPKTSDSGISSIIMVSALAGIAIIVSKKDK